MKLEKVHGGQVMKDRLGNNEEFGLYPMERASREQGESNWLCVEWIGRIRDYSKENSQGEAMEDKQRFKIHGLAWSWLVWLSGLNVGLRTKGSLVRFPIRALVWVVGQVSSRGRARSNHSMMFLCLSPSLLLCLKIKFKKVLAMYFRRKLVSKYV